MDAPLIACYAKRSRLAPFFPPALEVGLGWAWFPSAAEKARVLALNDWFSDFSEGLAASVLLPDIPVACIPRRIDLSFPDERYVTDDVGASTGSGFLHLRVDYQHMTVDEFGNPYSVAYSILSGAEMGNPDMDALTVSRYGSDSRLFDSVTITPAEPGLGWFTVVLRFTLYDTRVVWSPGRGPLVYAQGGWSAPGGFGVVYAPGGALPLVPVSTRVVLTPAAGEISSGAVMGGAVLGLDRTMIGNRDLGSAVSLAAPAPPPPAPLAPIYRVAV